MYRLLSSKCTVIYNLNVPLFILIMYRLLLTQMYRYLLPKCTVTYTRYEVVLDWNVYAFKVGIFCCSSLEYINVNIKLKLQLLYVLECLPLLYIHAILSQCPQCYNFTNLLKFDSEVTIESLLGTNQYWAIRIKSIALGNIDRRW